MGFFLIQIFIFRMLRNSADVRQYFELGLPVLAWEALWVLCIPLENCQQHPCLGPAVFVKLKI